MNHLCRWVFFGVVKRAMCTQCQDENNCGHSVIVKMDTEAIDTANSLEKEVEIMDIMKSGGSDAGYPSLPVLVHQVFADLLLQSENFESISEMLTVVGMLSAENIFPSPL
eukprot:CCRYP_016831-RA/>CCRYP_016831-RA protein AED:0.71 eAED:0.38 QI:0/0/0/1/0/0/2/0/109